MNFGEVRNSFYEENWRADDEANYEDKRELYIGDKFWNLLLIKIGIKSDMSIDNPEVLSISFNSQRERVKRKESKVIEAISRGDSDVENIDTRVGNEKERKPLIGNFNLDSQEITFNLSFNDMLRIDKKTKSTELAQVVIHELVHYVQRRTKKFSNINGIDEDCLVDTDSPWEREAYKLQYDIQLNRLFMQECNF